MKKILLVLMATLLAIALAACGAPASTESAPVETPALAEEPTPEPNMGVLQITSSPTGADVYINGAFVKSVSPCTLELTSGTHKVELKIPGYEDYFNESVQINVGETTALSDIKQLPSLTETDAAHTITVTTLEDKARWSDLSGMNAVTFAQLKVDTGAPISLREAIQAIKNEPAGSGHYRIEFDASLKGGTISLFRSDGKDFPVEDGLNQNLYIEKRGNMTINGDVDRDGDADITLEAYTNGTPGTPKSYVMNVYASDVTLAGLKFEGSETEIYNTLTFKVPELNTAKYDVNNVRVLGCTFENSTQTGIATCGGYGYAGTSYGGAGTTNFTDLVFSGNIFSNTKLFSFAGAGDEDYNVIDGYYVSANSFYNGCVGILAADANTWYVFGKNDKLGNGGVAGQIGFCEHNQIKNVYVTGNYFNHTEDADIILLATANHGHSNNLAENLYFRNNTSVVADGLFCSVMVENASIGRDERYTADEVCHNTANNTMRHVYFEDNDFDIGDIGRFGIYNVQEGCLEDSFMDGTGNLMEKIYIKDNRIQSKSGVFATGIGCFGGAINRDISGNTAQEIIFSGNEIIGKDSEWGTSGLRITNYYNVKNTHKPDYQDNVISDITVENNTISGYYKGIAIAGSFGNEADGQSIENVTVSGNTVICKPEGEYGIIVTGNLIDDYGGYYYNGSTNCGAKNITVSGNNITAPGGILLTGTYVNASVKGSLEGNHIVSVSVFNNTITKIGGAIANRPLPGITAADIIETWPMIEEGTTLDNNSCGELKIQDNTITGFHCSILDISHVTSEYPIGGLKTANEVLNDIETVTNAALGERSLDWNWYNGAFSSAEEGAFVAVASRTIENGFDYLYKCVNVVYASECSE